MTQAQDRPAPGDATRSRRTVLRCLVVVPLVLSLMVGVAWAFWTVGSAPGGNGAFAATSVNQGSTPTASATGRAVTITWAASNLTNGDNVAGYTVKRYDEATLTSQNLLSACTGTVASTACTENNVPAGQWVYSVTPRFATNWRGPESVKSTAVTVAAPTLVLTSTRVKPGTSPTGQAAGFLVGETLRYRLDSPTGTDLTGSLAGTSTPAAVQAGGGGSVVVTVPPGTSDGAHTIYAVASPSGDTATAAIVVDGTAPPLPVLTLFPASVSGDAATFAYTESESSATVECQLDGAGFAPCDNPTSYVGLTAGSHTFQTRATDTVGNVSAATSYSWTVDVTVPTSAIAFPTLAGLYNDAGFNAGCGTASTGDFCGTADDDTSVTGVSVSVKRLSTGLWWNGTSFTASTETFLAATGTTDWNYAIVSTALAEGDFTLRSRASDGTNFGYDSRTFTVDRTAPPTPTLTSVPPATSGPSATFAFTTTDATAGFECRLDSGAWNSCSSPQAYNNLSQGSHTVNVRAVDGAGNAGASTSTTWTVDAVPPTVAMTFPTTTRYNLSGWAAGCGTPATGDICGTASDVGSGLSQVAVSIRRASTNSYWDGDTFAASSETWLAATGTTSWSYLFAGASFPSDGSYTVRWRATDTVGNTTTGAVDLTVDTTPPPAPQIAQAPSDPSGGAAQFDFTGADAATSTECRLDAGAWATCSPPVGYTGLTNGSHTFGVRATDAAGNVSSTTSYTWTVDVGLPSISISFPAARPYSSATYAAGCGTPDGDICGTASDPGGSVAGVAVSIKRAGTSMYWNGTGFASATEVFLPATGTTAWSYALPAASFPADDSYTMHARATDNVGLTSFDTVTITIDQTAPSAPAITAGPTGTTGGNGDAFAFTGEAGASFECRLDAGSWAACTSPKTFGVIGDGSHTFGVHAVDGSGNVGATASRTWTVDATGPTIGTTFPATGGRYGTTSYNAGCGTSTVGDICGTASDSPSGVSKVEISVQRAGTGLYLTGTSFSAASQNWITATGAASWSYAIAATTFSTDGTYNLFVRATDSLGNTTTTSTAFVIDKTKPTGVGFTTTNIGTARKLELNDTFALTYSEAMDPASIIAGWNGTTTQNMVVRATNNSTSDKLTVYNATNTTLLPLGTLTLKRTDYVTSSMTFGLSGTASKLTMSGSSFTITLGTPSSTANTTAAAAANASWAPATGARDLAGNAALTTAYVETDLDSDF